jgi:hypothetical protein
VQVKFIPCWKVTNAIISFTSDTRLVISPHTTKHNTQQSSVAWDGVTSLISHNYSFDLYIFIPLEQIQRQKVPPYKTTTFKLSIIPNLSTVEIPLHSNVWQTASCQWHVTSGFMFIYIYIYIYNVTNELVMWIWVFTCIDSVEKRQYPQARFWSFWWWHRWCDFILGEESRDLNEQ